MQAVSHHLDHDATLVVADNPMEQRHAQPLSRRFGDNHRIAQRSLDLVDRRERRCHPQGKLIGRDIGLAVDRVLGILGITREIETRHGEARIVAAVEEHRVVLVIDAHTDHRVCRCRVVDKRIRNVKSARHHANLLAVVKAPVEVAAQIHVARIIGKSNARAHSASQLYVLAKVIVTKQKGAKHKSPDMTTMSRPGQKRRSAVL